MPHPLCRFVCLLVLLVAFDQSGQARAGLVPEADAWSFWDAADDTSAVVVDHDDWQFILDRYLDAAHPSGINRFDYAAVTAADRQRLAGYIGQLRGLDPRTLNRAEQMAYWINLYNALTVALVVDSYPVSSIRKIRGGLFNLGPWNEILTEVQGQALSLNDIEHRILRPLFADSRIHYAVNCASLGCPNLAAEAFRGASLEHQLDAAARAFINHPRAVRPDGRTLQLSSIYDWYGSDFGADEQALLAHLQRYAEPALAGQLAGFNGRLRYDYDWRLNAP